MKIRKLIVLGAAMAMGVTLAASSQQVVVQPSQAGQGGGQGGFVVRRPLEARVLKGQPYSAEITNESIQTLSDGNRIAHKNTGRVYRDVEGRVRREDDRPSGEPSITISDPVANIAWTLNPATKTAVEMINAGFFVSDALGALSEDFNFIRQTTEKPAAVGQPAGVVGGRGVGGARGAGAGAGAGSPTAGIVRRTDPQSVARAGGAGSVGGGGRGGRGAGSQQETASETLPNKSIENLLCTGVRRTTTIAKDAVGNEQPIKIVSEEWTSIDLQVLVLTDLNDPRSGHVTYKLTNVRRADPDLMLFKVPADYTITRSGGGRGRGGN